MEQSWKSTQLEWQGRKFKDEIKKKNNKEEDK